MPMTIRVPSDFEAGAARVLAFARELAGPTGAEVVVLHVYEPLPWSYPELPPNVIEDTTAALRTAAEKSLAEFAAKNGAPKTLLREGSPWAQIVAAVEEVRPWLVVMGTHGRRGLKRLVLGSVAERVVRHSSAPVVTVHPGE